MAGWDTIESIVLSALDLEPDARAAFADDACANDTGLRREVESLLAAHARWDAAPDPIAGRIAAAAVVLEDSVAGGRAGERVGSYRLVREIGRGGMGTVYQAERADDEYRARVAIKFVRGAYAAPELDRRFRAERQILADLRHPNIAQLLDGGATADGTPYLVMEYLDGEPIDVWCELNDLDIDARLSLFVPVCDAISCAHEARVVHSDLKPSNILVQRNGTPKVVDFGIAKLLEGDSAPEPTMLRPLTPAYASPEQLRGGPITVATDIYLLGAVLYRLLTGHAPAPRALHGRTLKPSDAASHRGGGWCDSLQAGLDEILMRALQNRPADRFRSASDLGDALRAYLRAGPATPLTIGARRARRLVRSHRRRFLAASTVAAGMLVFGGYYAREQARDAPFAFARSGSLETLPVPTPFNLAAADVTGDGRGDLVWTHMRDSTHLTRIATGNEDGTLTLLPPLYHPAVPLEGWHDGYVLITGDFNGDGVHDLMWNGRGTGQPNRVFVALAEGGGRFRYLPGATIGPTRWSPLWQTYVGDMDGDGADDLVFNILGRDMNTFVVSLSNRDGTFGAAHIVQHRAANWNGYRTFVADVDGDGRDDIVWNGALASGNRTYVARSRGEGNFDLLSYRDNAGDWSRYTAHVGDVDGDRRADISWVDTLASPAVVHVATGTVSAEFQQQPPHQLQKPAGAGYMPVSGGFDGTGRSRFMWERILPGDVIRVLDVNGDGRADVVRYDAAGGTTTASVSTRAR